MSSKVFQIADRVLEDRRIALATYRLQLNRSFTFRDVLEIVPYLQELGISDCYASPILKARAGSEHGYDICDLEQARDFGIIATDSSGRVLDFQEKPENPPPMPGDPGRAYASMGNYLFDTKILTEALEDANRQGYNDFGRHVLPRLLHSKRLFAYNFSSNKVPGIKDYEERSRRASPFSPKCPRPSGEKLPTSRSGCSRHAAPAPLLFVPEGIDRIQARRAQGRKEPAHQTDCDQDHRGDHQQVR